MQRPPSAAVRVLSMRGLLAVAAAASSTVAVGAVVLRKAKTVHDPHQFTCPRNFNRITVENGPALAVLALMIIPGTTVRTCTLSDLLIAVCHQAAHQQQQRKRCYYLYECGVLPATSSV